ncbi:uncharacterized protein LOC123896243 [Trifolium pratense]|uniref:uncharacterized protein LOC123896243 n=1 Tax=Trifolium pratense TaxID=57577 RepID=UPI001E69156C|nr:uncharacterized protein LOC123896243 [Trifolium pratense]
MSHSAKSSPTKTDAVPSPQMAINAIPLNTIPATSPTMRRKSVAKKAKSSRTNTNPSSPAAIKTRKGKKGKGESSKPFTMSELHINPLPSSGVATPVSNPTVENVTASGKISVNLGLNTPKSDKTLGVETPDMSENLGKSDTDKEAVPDKVVKETPEVIIVNETETTVSDKAAPTNSEASVARRTRSRAGKAVEATNTPVQTPKPSRAEKVTCKKPLYGPPKPVSKVVPRTETRKRKAPPTSDSEFEPETDCFDRLVKEFLINVAENCNDPRSPEYRQVFVRGKCVKFSPIVINQYLQRSSDEVAPLKATDNEVCKVLTGGRIKMVYEGRGQSIWWRDLLKIGREDNGDWFRSNISNVLGQRNAIHFWKDKWYGSDYL